MEIMAVVSRIISHKYGGLTDDIFALEYPNEMKIQLSNLKNKEKKEKILKKINKLDQELTKIDINHKELNELHENLLNKLGISNDFFIKDIISYKDN